jgi:hypothetical protein
LPTSAQITISLAGLAHGFDNDVLEAGSHAEGRLLAGVLALMSPDQPIQYTAKLDPAHSGTVLFEGTGQGGIFVPPICSTFAVNVTGHITGGVYFVDAVTVKAVSADQCV